MPKIVYKCSDCKSVYDKEADAENCEERHRTIRENKKKVIYCEDKPQFVRIGDNGTVMRLCHYNKKYVDFLDAANGLPKISGYAYYRDAGCWYLDFKEERGQYSVVGRGKTKHLDGVDLVACTEEEYIEDNRGYLDGYNLG